MALPADLIGYENDPRLFLFTSLTAGSSHIITATSRLETILKANKIPFQAIDVATEEQARKLWGRRAGKRKLPGLVKEGYILGDLEQIEEWNEFGELKENVGPITAPTPSAAPAQQPAVVQQTQPASGATNPATPDPTRAAATQAAAVGAARKGPHPGVDRTKIRPLPGSTSTSAGEHSEDKKEPDTTTEAVTTAPLSDQQSSSDTTEPDTTGSVSADNEQSIPVATGTSSIAAKDTAKEDEGDAPVIDDKETEVKTDSASISTAKEVKEEDSTTQDTLATFKSEPAKDVEAEPLESTSAASKTKEKEKKVEPEAGEFQTDPAIAKAEEPATLTHQGSIVEQASEAEVKEVEQSTAIHEEQEPLPVEQPSTTSAGEDKTTNVAEPVATPKEEGSTAKEPVSAPEEDDPPSTETTAVEAEERGTETVTQKQESGEPKSASIRVED